MQKFIKFLVIFLIVVLMLFLCYSLILFYQLDKINVRQTKDYNSFVVEKGEFADYRVFVYCNDKYQTLKQIGLEMRTEVANYMFLNNLKLCEGEQEFIRNEPTFNELINDNFKFEKIEKSDMNKANVYGNLPSIEIRISNDDINANYIKNTILGKIKDNTNLKSLNDVVLYNIYLFLNEYNYRIKEEIYIVNNDWWFYNGKFYYNGSKKEIFNYDSKN